MSDEPIIIGRAKDWKQTSSTPIADLRAFIEYAKTHSAPLDERMEMRVNLDVHPIHLLSWHTVMEIVPAILARGYAVTVTTLDEGYLVDWEKTP